MPTGFIKKFLADRGVGFIKPDGGGKDVRFRLSVVNDIDPGAQVEFSIGKDPKTGKTYASRVAIKGFAQPGAAQSHSSAASAALPSECVFESFYDENSKLRMELFISAAEKAAGSFKAAGVKSSQLRALYQAFLSFAGPLRDKRMDFATARERFGVFYVERVVRQHKRGHLPDTVKRLIDAHRELVLSKREELLGLFRYLTNILCYFGDKDEKR